jgi:hypothetical protein
MEPLLNAAVDRVQSPGATRARSYDGLPTRVFSLVSPKFKPGAPRLDRRVSAIVTIVRNQRRRGEIMA